MDKIIWLTKGKFAIVNDEDYNRVSKHKWTYNSNVNGYAFRQTCKNGKYIYHGMHRFILNAPENMLVDHKNMDGLDNRRENLRYASKSTNAINSKKMTNTISKYKGVSWDKSRNKWIAKIMKNQKTINLGRFDNEEDAARAYDKAAFELFGEFARLNSY